MNDKHNFVLPHEKSSSPFNSKEYFQKDCDLVIAEISGSSIGLGIEIGWADAYGLPIIFVYQKGTPLPSYLDKLSNRSVSYSDDNELVFGLEAAIRFFR